MSRNAVSTAYVVEGDEIGVFAKAQYLGEHPVVLDAKTPEEQLAAIKGMANSAIEAVSKVTKHRKLAYSRCHITTTGIYIYETEKGADGTPTLKWGSKAQDIYCVVMGRRQKWFSNQLACIMWVKPGTAPRVPFPMNGIIVEFHHDRKNEALKFHEASENMMNSLLFAEMSKMRISKPSIEPVPEDAVADTAAAGGDEDEGPGYMDIPQELVTGRKARASIDMSNEEDTDYMMVVVSRKLSMAAYGEDFE